VLTILLPTIISEYLPAFDRGNLDAGMACLTDGAVVFDQAEEVRGHADIRQLGKVATAYERTVEVLSSTEPAAVDGLDRHDMHTHLEGNIPGGKVDLPARFRLRAGRNASLEFAPSEVAEA
jgi:hypothetical protein